jgi:hypothetical protein
MTGLSTSALAVSRRIVCAIATATVVACIAVGVTVALPGTSDSASGAAFRVQPEFDLVFASLNAAARLEAVPDSATPIAFDLVFASIARPQPDNTPQNREKLRNAGWRRVLQKS